MIVVKRGLNGPVCVAANNHTRRTLESPSTSEKNAHEAELSITLFGKRDDYRLLLTVEDIRRIARYARLHGLE
jgi:hypothetical protein